MRVEQLAEQEERDDRADDQREEDEQRPLAPTREADAWGRDRTMTSAPQAELTQRVARG